MSPKPLRLCFGTRRIITIGINAKCKEIQLRAINWGWAYRFVMPKNTSDHLTLSTKLQCTKDNLTLPFRNSNIFLKDQTRRLECGNGSRPEVR